MKTFLDVMRALTPSFAPTERAGAMPSRTRRPRGGVLYQADALRAGGDRMLAACRRRGIELSIVVLDFSDLLEVRRLYGRRVSAALFRLILDKLAQVAGREGLVACTSPALLTVAVPLGAADALGAVHRALGKTAHVELDSQFAEVVVVPNYVADRVQPGESFQSRHEAIVGALAARNAGEQGRLRHIRRARERHSRPAVLESRSAGCAAKY
jgi:hypothetical protein